MKKQQEIKVFITGATGFIGKQLLQETGFSRYTIYALTRKPSTPKESNKDNITYLTGSLSDISQYSYIIKECKYIIHIAGEKRNETAMEETNITGTEILLKELINYPDIRLIHISSGGVFGITKHTAKIITEDSQCFPANVYERTKLKAEKLIEKYSAANSFRYIILRPTNVFGEMDKARKLLNLCRALLQNKFILLSKTANVNYVYAGYLTGVIDEIIKKNIFTNQIYIVNSPCNIYEFISLLKKELEINKGIILAPGILKPFFYIAAKLFDNLPERLQKFNTEKYIELTNEKIYSAKKISALITVDEKEFLKKGLKNIVEHYKKEGLL